MFTRIAFSLLLAFSLSACGQGRDAEQFAPIGVAMASAPPFLRVGASYRISIPGGGLGGNEGAVQVVEIDKGSGWIKVKADQAQFWINLGQVLSIGELPSH